MCISKCSDVDLLTYIISMICVKY